MGSVYHGIPPELALDLKQKYDLQLFVETGTLMGRTAEWASVHFEQVYTMEIAYNLFALAKSVLKSFSNVQLIYGDSQAILKDLVPMLSKPTLFWLDAHWSRDLGYPKFDAAICPVLEEIATLSTAIPDHVVLVDDLRLFGNEPGWPNKMDVKDALEKVGKKVTYSADVFIAVPNGKE